MLNNVSCNPNIFCRVMTWPDVGYLNSTCYDINFPTYPYYIYLYQTFLVLLHPAIP